MVILGAGNCHIYNLDTYSSTDISHACTGDTAIIGADAPGLAYDPVGGKMVAWNGGTSVYTFDIPARRWTRVQPAVTNTANPGSATSTGTYGRWRYIPSRNVFFIVNGIDKNVFLYRLNAGATAAESPCPAAQYDAPVRWSGLYDIRGRRVAEGERWETSRLPAGVYLLGGRAGAQRVFRKVLVAR